MFGLHSVKGLDAIPNALCWVQLAQLSKCTKTSQRAEIVTAQSELFISIVGPRMLYTWCVNPGSSYNAGSFSFGNYLFALYFFICEMTDLRVSGLRLRLWLKTNARGSKVVCTQLEWQRPHTRIFFSSVLLASIWWVGYVGYTRCREREYYWSFLQHGISLSFAFDLHSYGTQVHLWMMTITATSAMSAYKVDL